MIDVRQHLPLIERLLTRYGVPIAHLSVVNDVYEWCKENDVPEDWPFRAAKCIYSPSECYVSVRLSHIDAKKSAG